MSHRVAHHTVTISVVAMRDLSISVWVPKVRAAFHRLHAIGKREASTRSKPEFENTKMQLVLPDDARAKPNGPPLYGIDEKLLETIAS